MGRSRRSRLGPRAIAATAALGAVAAGGGARSGAICARSPPTRTTGACARPWAGARCGSPPPTGPSCYAEAFGPDDGDTVVLAHGWTEQLTYWGPVIKRLRAHGLRVVAYDLRGHGRSRPAADGDYALRALRRGPGGGAGRGGRRRRARAGDGGRPFAGRDVDRRLGRAPRSAHAGARRGAAQHRAGRSGLGPPAAAAGGAVSQPPLGEPGAARAPRPRCRRSPPRSSRR